MLYRLVRTCLLLVLSMTATVAQALNEDITIVLHARDGFAPCDDPQQQGICIDRPPTLDLTGMQPPFVYVMLRNYDQVRGLQCAFDWPLEWTYVGGIWDCRPGAFAIVPTAPGPITGTLQIAFSCVQSGALLTLGQMIFVLPSDADGCLSVIESAFVYGTHVVDCSIEETPVDPSNRGRVCAGPGGYDACVPASTPVESVTWGAIKGQYR